ncbi:MAG TPA: DUF2306 domain-containing protein [Dokdonella sp.]
MPRLRSVLRWTAQTLFTLTSVLVAAYAFTYLYRSFRVGDPFAAQFALSGWDVPLHFFGAGLALLLAPLQVAAGVRRRLPALHRTAGWLYVAAILVGGTSGLSLAFNAQGGAASGVGFALLALLWLAITVRGVLFAVAGDIARHRRWMCRSVALTFAAVTLRVMLGVGGGVLGLPFMPVYITAAWASWLINLAMCELILRWPVPRPPAAGGSRWVSRPVAA